RRTKSEIGEIKRRLRTPLAGSGLRGEELPGDRHQQQGRHRGEGDADRAVLLLLVMRGALAAVLGRRLVPAARGGGRGGRPGGAVRGARRRDRRGDRRRGRPVRRRGGRGGGRTSTGRALGCRGGRRPGGSGG